MKVVRRSIAVIVKLGIGRVVLASGLFTSYAYGQAPSVVVQLEGVWPPPLASELKADLDASLSERGVMVLPEGSSSARATVRILPPTDETFDVHVVIVDSARVVLAERHLWLTREHPDTWSVAIAAAADELLAVTWNLPERGTPKPAEESAPAPVLAVDREVSREVAQEEPPDSPQRHIELGLGLAAEQYSENGRTYGANVFGGFPLGQHVRVELGGLFRRLASRSSSEGNVSGTLVGGDLLLAWPVVRGAWVGLDVLGAVHGAVVWFDAEPADGALANSVTGALLSARLGTRLALFTSERTRLGLLVTGGLPMVRAVASDSTRDVVKLGGAELGARLEAAWNL